MRFFRSTVAWNLALSVLSVVQAVSFVSSALSLSWTTPQVPAKGSSIYYVDSRDGNDANTGTAPGAAWRTLEKVNATTFRPWDTILLRSSSVWRGQLWPKGSGTEGHPIRVGTYGGGVKPVVNGEGLVEDAVLLKNQEYWEIENLEVTNTGPTRAVRRGVHLALENFGDAHHIYIRSLTIHDVNGVNGVDSLKSNGGINYTSTWDTKPSRFVDLRIEDNEIYHVDRSGIFGWSEEWMRSKWHPSLGVIVRGNQLHDIGADGIVVAATDGALVENNVVGHASQRSEDYNVAIWAWSADNTIIQYNEAYGTKGQRDGEGFDSDWNSRNTVIQYNYSHDNDGGFLLICNEGGHEITENAGNSGTIVRYNISRNDRSRGITIAGPVKNTLVYNNTIYTGPDRTLDMLLFADWNGWSEDTYFFNNIFFAAGPAQFSHGVSRASDGAYTTAPGLEPSKNNIFESNLYYGVNPPPGDKGALTADPKLVDPTRGGMGRFSLSGYHLQPTSAARASGKAIQNNGRRDFWGHAVPSCNKTDRGASQSDNCEAVAAEHHER